MSGSPAPERDFDSLGLAAVISLLVEMPPMPPPEEVAEAMGLRELFPPGNAHALKYASRRNAACPCGSGKKFKRCCINQIQEKKESQ